MNQAEREMNFDVEAGERVPAVPPGPTAPLPSGSTRPRAETSPASAPVFEASDVQSADDKLALYYEPCPQGDDCAGDGKHRRLFDCDQGCGFRGCAACMEIHDSEPHASDSGIRLEMFRNIRS